MSSKSEPNSNIASSPYSSDGDAILLTNLMLTLARQLKIIVITPIVFCIFAIIYAFFLAQPVYTSVSKIMSSSGGGASKAIGLAAQFGINIPTGQSEPNWVYPEIIKSRTLAKSLLKKKFDTEKFGPQKQLFQILTYGNGDPQVGLDTLEIVAVNKLLRMINISEDKTTGILTLRISASDPTFAADVNHALIKELDMHQLMYNKAKTSDTKQFILERIESVENDLINAEEDLKVFRDRNRRIENSPALQLEQERLYREVSVLTGVFTTLKQQLETTKIEEVKESDYVVILDPPEIPLSKSKPNEKLLIILSGLSGLGIGIILAFLRDFIANAKKEEKDKISRASTLISKNISELFRGKLK